MRKYFIRGVCISTVIAASATAALTAAEDAFGTWVHAPDGSTITLYACGSGLCAEPAKNAPEPGALFNWKRKRFGTGLLIMGGAHKQSENQWKGQLYSREDGAIYAGVITVVNQGELKFEGCSFGGLVCKDAIWTRVAQ